MNQEQRRVILAVCLIVGMSLLMVAGLTFLISPMAEDLQLSDRAVDDLLAIPSSAALIMVFSAGQMGDRLGARRTLVIGSVAFSVGSAIVLVASSEYLVAIGLALCAAAAVTVQIVGLSLLQQATVEGSAQVSAMTWFGAIFPLAFLIFPVATAGILDVTQWRIVPFLWVLAGLIMVVVTLFLPRASTKTAPATEWATPLFAGVALFALARAAAEIDDVEADPALLASSAVVLVVAVIAFVITRRAASRPSLTLAPIRERSLFLLIVAVALVSLSGLLTYVSIAIEYLYAMTPYEASLAVIPAQIGAIVGAKVLARFAINHWGGISASIILMLFLALSMLPLLFLRVDSPLFFLVVVATIFSCAWMGVLTVLNAQVMRRAPSQHTGAVSAFRAAASSIGTAVGVGVIGSLVISSVEIDAGLQGMDADALERLTDSLRLAGLVASLIAMIGFFVLHYVRRIDTVSRAAR